MLRQPPSASRHPSFAVLGSLSLPFFRSYFSATLWFFSSFSFPFPLFRPSNSPILPLYLSSSDLFASEQERDESALGAKRGIGCFESVERLGDSGTTIETRSLQTRGTCYSTYKIEQWPSKHARCYDDALTWLRKRGSHYSEQMRVKATRVNRNAKQS